MRAVTVGTAQDPRCDYTDGIGIGGGRYDRAPATPPGMRVRTGRFEELRSGEAGDTEGIHPPEG
ncbi:hypothetical protein CN068_24695 [Sinorhizobium meliloti]|nr:hypothetical protein CN068_24695 [Sinorhizobium meliloti]